MRRLPLRSFQVVPVRRFTPRPLALYLLLLTLLLQTDLQEVGLGEPGIAGPQYVKPEHLSTVIASSAADFLIVIGDRNMRNDTVQARRSGKLVEMPIGERLTTLLEAWAAALGLRPAAGSTAAAGGVALSDRASASLPDASLSDRAIASLTEDALFERLKRLTGVAHPQERLQRLIATAAEVADLRKGRRGAAAAGPMLMTGDGRLTESDHTLVR